MKKAIRMTLVIIIGTAALVGFMLYLQSLPRIPDKIFESLDELKSFDKYTTAHVAANNDTALSSDMKVTLSDVRTLDYEGHKYIMYSYIFDSDETAKAYYSANGLSITDSSPGTYCMNSGFGLSGTECVFVCYGYNCAYKIVGDSGFKLQYMLYECSAGFSRQI